MSKIQDKGKCFYELIDRMCMAMFNRVDEVVIDTAVASAGGGLSASCGPIEGRSALDAAIKEFESRNFVNLIVSSSSDTSLKLQCECGKEYAYRSRSGTSQSRPVQSTKSWGCPAFALFSRSKRYLDDPDPAKKGRNRNAGRIVEHDTFTLKEWRLEINDHNHQVSEEIWKSTTKQRKLTMDDKANIRQMNSLGVAVKNMVKQLNLIGDRKIGNKTVRNYLATLKPSELELLKSLDIAIKAVEEENGHVKTTTKDSNDDQSPATLSTIFIATKTMIDQYNKEKPTLIMQDTTFKTNVQRYKLLKWVFVDRQTNMK